MIVGNGNIAKVLTDRPDVTFFASGVSDSSCTDESLFEREKDLLNKQDFKQHLVYFSNLGIYRWDNRYIQHKKEMESLVKKWFYSYTIVRIEVLEWVDNKNTIQNFFRRMLKEGKPITIQDTHRYLLSLEEFKYWMELIPVGEKNEMNILGTKVHVSDIYKLVKDGKL